jgi:thiamine-monophosphate kinase
VTGELGASAAGLLALEGDVEGFGRLKGRHLRPRPRVEAGLAASRLGVGAMIDLSDGLASDVRRVCERSGVGCEVDLGLLPVAADTRELAASLGREPGVLAATGGEDYELLVCAPERVLRVLAETVEVPVTIVGRVTKSGVEFGNGGDTVERLSGWDHFA